jgi:hypothetical protein
MHSNRNQVGIGSPSRARGFPDGIRLSKKGLMLPTEEGKALPFCDKSVGIHAMKPSDGWASWRNSFHTADFLTKQA